jgi:hypothetical protein
MNPVRITIDGVAFTAFPEEAAAPATLAAFAKMLPYENRIIHVRWSGEACWIPMGDYRLDVGPENATAYPAPGHVLFYPGGVSETEILLAYGPSQFASKAGVLAGNHFLTIRDGLDELARLGRKTLWEGAQKIVFEAT